MRSSVAVVVLVVLNLLPSSYEFMGIYYPEQIHLSYGELPNEMKVTWVTTSATNSSVVEYSGSGPTDFDLQANGTQTLFVDGGAMHRHMYIHMVTLQGLMPGQRYYYHVGSDLDWSAVYNFVAMKSGTEWSPSIAMYGDMGTVNAKSLPRLQEETQRGMYDAVIHVGDFAYNMDFDNAKVGDDFMREIQPIAAYIPYMTCVGNHEYAYNFSNYKARFSMPNTDDNMMYSFNMGPVHFVAMSTEFYFYLQYGFTQIVEQYRWLEKDLQEASHPEARAVRPWIVLFGHRPMYCSNSDDDDCTKVDSRVRTGLPFIHLFGVEKLMWKYGVDLAVWAHEHSYERLWPIFNRQIMNGTKTHPYTNPGAPVHVITGSAGCLEKHDGFKPDVPYFTAFRSEDYGYTRLRVLNKTHLYIEQVSDDQAGKVIDNFWLVKNRHAPFYQLKYYPKNGYL